MNAEDVVTCTSCKNCRENWFLTILSFGRERGEYAKCGRVIEFETILDPVTGREKKKKTKNNSSYCSIEREFGPCGPEGKFWTPKHKKDLFKLLKHIK